MKMDFTGKHITVVGLARTGVAVAKLLTARGAKVTITDIKPAEQLQDYLRELPAGVELALGGHPKECFIYTDLIVVSPGVPLDMPQFMLARAANIEIISEIELAYRLDPQTPIIAVTGSNGKSTTTTLIGNVLTRAGKRVFVGGNLGYPVAEDLLAAAPRDYRVLEISSFQLEAVNEFRPHISVVLNITSNHLDRYAGMHEYAQAKFQMFKRQTASDYAILNADDELSQEAVPGIKAAIYLFSRRQSVGRGVMLDGDQLILCRDGQRHFICNLSDIRLKGAHNLENVMAVVAVAVLCGIDPDVLRRELRSFTGLEHRLEPVREIGGVQFINDSKATTVIAALTALDSFNQPIILIAGGKDKGADFRPLGEEIRRKVKSLILIGKDGYKIRNAINSGYQAVTEAKSMEDAVQTAYSQAQSGDVVLLSPACASFDMFTDFEHRGRIFKQAVLSLVPNASHSAGDNPLQGACPPPVSRG